MMPQNKNDIPHIVNAWKIGNAHRGNIKNILTLSGAPPINHEVIPSNKNIAPDINILFTSISLISCEILSQ